jgi:hypothetical protein
MSFYFYYNTLKVKSIIKIKQRFQRILIPYIIWPTFVFIFNKIIINIFGFTKFQRKLKLKDLVLQLIFGFKYQVVFYYQFNLLFLTIIFTIISFSFNNNFIFIFQFFLIIAYFFQYSGCNKYIFKKYALVVRIPLGSFLELLPFAVAGITLHYFDIIINLKKNKKFSFYFVLVLFFLFLNLIYLLK